MDRVNTSTGAAVLGGGASASSSALSGSVADHIAFSRASTLEDVIETQPMSNFVRQSLSLVIVLQTSSGQARVEDNNTIVFRVSGIVGWESGIAEKTLSITGLEADGVDVEGGCVTFAERALHFGLGSSLGTDTAEPAGVAGAGGLGQTEGDTRRAIVFVHSVNVGLDFAIRDVSSGGVVTLGDDVPDDGDRSRRSSLNGNHVGGIRAETFFIGGDSSLIQVRSASTEKHEKMSV